MVLLIKAVHVKSFAGGLMHRLGVYSRCVLGGGGGGRGWLTARLADVVVTRSRAGRMSCVFGFYTTWLAMGTLLCCRHWGHRNVVAIAT